MADLMGRAAHRDEMVAFTRQELIGTALPATSRVLLKFGADGAVLIGKHSVVDARPPVVQPVNTVGCGDALLAGFLSAEARGRDPGETLGDAVAVATAASLEEAIGEVDLTKVAAIRERVQIEVHGESPPAAVRTRA
jgi:tagatose 6-phosphate kinase